MYETWQFISFNSYNGEITFDLWYLWFFLSYFHLHLDITYVYSIKIQRDYRANAVSI
jgi:hypothetical protein